jgi:hypothetical protein
MATEFQYNLKLAQMKSQETQTKDAQIEDRKDKRIEKEGSQQSQLIEQRQTQGLPKDFEKGAAGAMGGMDMSQFMPQ